MDVICGNMFLGMILLINRFIDLRLFDVVCLGNFDVDLLLIINR